MRTSPRDVERKGDRSATRGRVFERAPALLGAFLLLSTTVAFAGTQLPEDTQQPWEGYFGENNDTSQGALVLPRGEAAPGAIPRPGMVSRSDNVSPRPRHPGGSAVTYPGRAILEEKE